MNKSLKNGTPYTRVSAFPLEREDQKVKHRKYAEHVEGNRYVAHDHLMICRAAGSAP
jgi:hypothetical protein